MANQAHLGILKKGVTHWNSWRMEEGDILPDLRKADLHGLNLSNYDLSLCRMEGAVLSKAKLKRTDLRAADLKDADLSDCLLEGAYLIETRLTRTDLRRAYLKQANLSDSDLTESCLKEADLTEANLYSANLKSTDLQGASLCSANLIEARFLHTVLEGADISHSNLYETLFLNVELDKVQGLDCCNHYGPSVLDHRTLLRSHNLPETFLTGCGLPDSWIAHRRNPPAESDFSGSCYLVYSKEDESIAVDLHERLQKCGVRTWFAPDALINPASFSDYFDRTLLKSELRVFILSSHSVQNSRIRKYGEEILNSESDGVPGLIGLQMDSDLERVNSDWVTDLKNSNRMLDAREWKESPSRSMITQGLIGLIRKQSH